MGCACTTPFTEGEIPGEICYDISKGPLGKGMLSKPETKLPKGVTTLRLVNPKGVDTMPTITHLNGIVNVVVDESCSTCTRMPTYFLCFSPNLISVDLAGLKNCTVVSGAFLHGCKLLESVDLLPLSNCTAVGSFFLAGCKLLTSVELSPLSNCSHLSQGFLAHCEGLKSVNLSPLSKVRKVGCVGSFLEGCTLEEVIVVKGTYIAHVVGGMWLDNCKVVEMTTFDTTGTTTAPRLGMKNGICCEFSDFLGLYNLPDEEGHGSSTNSSSSSSVNIMALDKRNKRKVVLKRFNTENEDDNQAGQRLKEEFKEFENVAHPHLRNAVAIISDTSMWMVMEFMSEEGTLENMSGRLRSWAAVRSVIIQSLQGLQHLHNLKVLHRNLNPHNIYMQWEADGSLQVKIANFTLSKKNNDDTADIDTIIESPRKATKVYAPREVAKHPHHHSTKSDVYSWACCIAQLATGLHPNDWKNAPPVDAQAPDDAQFLPYSAQDLAEVGLCLEPAVVLLLMSCLQHDRDRRPDVDALIASINSIDTP